MQWLLSMDELRGIPVSRRVVFWSLAVGGCAADLWTKHWMFAQPDLLAGNVRWLWAEHVGFQLSLNEGALFGLGQGGAWLFAACAAAAAVAIPVWLFRFGAAQDWRLTTALGAILGGVLGNLYDRVGLPALMWGDFNPARAGERVHAVRDFILVAWRWNPRGDDHLVWPNFNVADSLLVCGAVALVLISLRPRGGHPAASSVAEQPPQPT